MVGSELAISVAVSESVLSSVLEIVNGRWLGRRTLKAPHHPAPFWVLPKRTTGRNTGG